MVRVDVRKKLFRKGEISSHPIRGRPTARLVIERLVGSWSTTPGRFRVARTTLVLVLLVTGATGGSVVNVHTDSVREIEQRYGPLSMGAAELYRSLADMNATVTSGFLAGGADSADVRELYDSHLRVVTPQLIDAAIRAADDPISRDRIADIGAQLYVYTGLVERARANYRPGSATGVDDLQAASDLMQQTILPAADQLQRIQAKRLTDEYQRAGSVPVPALVMFVVSLGGLVWAQIMLFRRTRRVFNVGLVVSTLAVVGALLCWTAGSVVYHGDLEASTRRSQSVTNGLGRAQIAALQARAGESLALLARDSTAGEQRFAAEMQILARDDGAGGALGAAWAFASDDRGRVLVQAALAETRGYRQAHQQVRTLNEAGQSQQAVAAAVGAGNTSTAAFKRLDQGLAKAAAYERAEFTSDVTRARHIVVGLLVGTGLLTLSAVIGVIWGIGQRLREYPVSVHVTETERSR